MEKEPIDQNGFKDNQLKSVILVWILIQSNTLKCNNMWIVDIK